MVRFTKFNRLAAAALLTVSAVAFSSGVSGAQPVPTGSLTDNGNGTATMTFDDETGAAISILVHPAGVILLLIFGANAILPFVILHGIGVGLNPFIRGSLPLLFFGSESYGERQGQVMMLSKIVSALSPTLMTVMVLANPTMAVTVTMSLGLTAMLLLLVVASMRKTSN